MVGYLMVILGIITALSGRVAIDQAQGAIEWWESLLQIARVSTLAAVPMTMRPILNRPPRRGSANSQRSFC